MNSSRSGRPLMQTRYALVAATLVFAFGRDGTRSPLPVGFYRAIFDLPQGDVLAALHAIEADQVGGGIGPLPGDGEIIPATDHGQHPPASGHDLALIVSGGAGVKDDH